MIDLPLTCLMQWWLVMSGHKIISGLLVSVAGPVDHDGPPVICVTPCVILLINLPENHVFTEIHKYEQQIQKWNRRSNFYPDLAPIYLNDPLALRLRYITSEARTRTVVYDTLILPTYMTTEVTDYFFFHRTDSVGSADKTNPRFSTFTLQHQQSKGKPTGKGNIFSTISGDHPLGGRQTVHHYTLLSNK